MPLLLLLVVSALPKFAYGQEKVLFRNTVDTLQWWQSIALRTNMAGWAEMTPNAALEFTLGSHNWNKWTLSVGGRLNWRGKSPHTPYHVYDLYEGRLQLRKYWHARDPRRVFYWGVYTGYEKYDMKLTKTGYRGNGFIGGLSIGTVKQIYGYRNGASLDLDLGLNLGVLYASKEEYVRQKDANGNYSFVVTSPNSGKELVTKPLPMIAAMDPIHIGLVYHFGTTVANRYKKRKYVDQAYLNMITERQYRLDSLDREHKKAQQIRRDSLEEADYQKRFEQQRKEIERQYEQREQQLKKERAKLDAEDQSRHQKGQADTKATNDKKKGRKP